MLWNEVIPDHSTAYFYTGDIGYTPIYTRFDPQSYEGIIEGSGTEPFKLRSFVLTLRQAMYVAVHFPYIATTPYTLLLHPYQIRTSHSSPHLKTRTNALRTPNLPMYLYTPCVPTHSLCTYTYTCLEVSVTDFTFGRPNIVAWA